ncbi:hypothetical protein CgunFtcFv8_012705 [Champsocephalus gunnari]|uniref:Uncharacterized protein n=1 Tax=Champsocephalus gunnari TaxID=52237 RepID=A0AAN8DSB8_CHAGU|nr:hypothetical protein CgunFtcFv8_012705 [Champsocephalus gunnari]
MLKNFGGPILNNKGITFKMDTPEETYPDGPQLPAASCVSMKSDVSLDIRHDFTKEVADGSVNESKLPASSMSMKSDHSLDIRPDFKEDAGSSLDFENSKPQDLSCLSLKSNISMKVRHDFSKDNSHSNQHDRPESTEMDTRAIFKSVDVHIKNIVLRELQSYERKLFPHLSHTSESEMQNEDTMTSEEIKPDNDASEGVLKITLHVLKEMGQRELANKLEKHIYEEGLLRLLPVIKESRVALLKECSLTEKSCKLLGDVLSNSYLKELDLSDNDLQDSGVELLSTGLASPTCQLEKLRLLFCGITEIGCGHLATALKANPSHLKELDLSYNHPGQTGEELLSCLQRDIEHLTVRLNGNAECYLKSSLKKYVFESQV